MPLDPDLDGYVVVETLTLEDLLATGRLFHLPWAQRAYAWPDDVVTRLLSDIITAWSSPKQRYFLGYLSVAAATDGARAPIVDGQQRLITLTLLFALLRDRVSDASVKDACAGVLQTAHDGALVIAVQNNIADAFEAMVRAPQAAGRHGSAHPDRPHSEAADRLFENVQAIASALDQAEIIGPRADAFARFVLNRCLVILQTVDNEPEALQILATEEETGLPFHSSERAKVTLLSVLPARDQPAASEIWEECQARLGNEGLGRLLAHIRVLALGGEWRGKATTPVETDIAKRFELDNADNGLRFISDTLARHGRTFDALAAGALPANADATPSAVSTINAALAPLSWSGLDLWVPAALAWGDRQSFGHRETARFFWALERLTWLVRLSGVDPIQRERAFARLIDDVRDGGPVDAMANLQVSDRIRQRALDNLRSHTFASKKWAPALLRRLSVVLGEDCGPHDGKRVTTEHILPRSPRPGSVFAETFSGDHAADRYAGRLGNFALLTFDENQSADNRDWAEKALILKASPHILAREAAEWGAWTPATIDDRGETLIDRLFQHWELSTSA